MPAYLIHVATLIAIYIMVVSAYSLPVGYTGMVNFGHIGLLAVGAYSSAIITTHGYSFWLALPVSALLTGLAGFFMAIPGRRIKGDYFALITLGFTFLVNAVILNGRELTRGPFGITGIARPAGFDSPASFLLLSVIAMAFVLFAVYTVVKSPFGRALEAVRDDDLTAEALGKPTAKLRLISLILSAVLAGIAGTFLAHFIQFINASIFWLDNVVWVLSSLVIGGLASFSGSIIGTVLLFLLLEAVRFLPIDPAIVGPLRLIIFSSLLLLVVIFRPKGLLGRAQLE